LYDSVNLAPDREIWPPGRPVGRGVGGRIVAGELSTTTYRWPPGLWTAVAELPLFRENAVIQSASRGTDRAYARDRLPVKGPAPELPRSPRRSVPSLAADSARRSRRDSIRYWTRKSGRNSLPGSRRR